MKPLLSLRRSACFVLFSFLPVTAALAQGDSPTPSPLPSKPVTVLTTPTPSPTVAAEATPQPTAAPTKKEKSSEEKAKQKAERLKKYDTNKDGKLDDQERAAMRADREKEGKAPKASPQP